MKKQLIAYISVGRGCMGQQIGDYGQFEVELSEAEWSQIDSIVKAGSNKYLREVLKESNPKIDKKIIESATSLVDKVTKTYSADVTDVEVCYYLTPTEIPADYEIRTGQKR